MRKILIIAEAGVNHNGLISNCYKLIDAAKNVGADIVKFQTFKATTLSTKKSPKAEYQKKFKKNETQFEMLQKLELSRSDHFRLSKYCKKRNIEFLSSAFDIDDLNFLKKMKLKRLKIPSGEITNYFYLKKVASFKKEVILSTGMSNIKEVSDAINILSKNGLSRSKIKLLHCSSEYPASLSSLNLNAIKSLKKKFKVEGGYSDHSLSLISPSVAISLGAKIIEKHLTLNNNLPGPDHKSSLNPNDFKKMVNFIRQTEISLGSGKKIPSKKEIENAKIVRKSIVAKRLIKKGERFSIKNLTFKRPGTGISPMKIKKLLKKKAKKNYKIDDLIVLKI